MIKWVRRILVSVLSLLALTVAYLGLRANWNGTFWNLRPAEFHWIEIAITGPATHECRIFGIEYVTTSDPETMEEIQRGEEFYAREFGSLTNDEVDLGFCANLYFAQVIGRSRFAVTLSEKRFLNSQVYSYSAVTTPVWFPVLLFASYPIVHLVLFVRGPYRRRRRARRGLCLSCGYDLTGNTSDVCPECGQAI